MFRYECLRPIWPYLERPIRTCGLLQVARNERDRILYEDTGPEWYDGAFVQVDSASIPLPAARTYLCITGIVRRRDGISE